MFARALSIVALATLLASASACAPPAGVAAPTVGEASTTSSATTAPTTKSGAACDALRDIPAARELARELNGDLTILKYSVDFREHAQVMATARAAGAPAAQPFVILGVNAIGPRGVRSVAARGVDGDAFRALQKYVVAGSLDALEHAGDVPEVGIGAELADALGVSLGGEMTIALHDERALTTKPVTLKKARVGALFRFPGGESLTSFGMTLVAMTMARAAALDSAMPSGGATGVLVWTDKTRTEIEWVEALTQALGNAIYRVVRGSELDGGLRLSVAALEAYCR